jgi:hypothetical protein
MRTGPRWGVLLGVFAATTGSPAQTPAGLSERTAAITRKLDVELSDLENLYKHLHSHPEGAIRNGV